MRGWQRQAGCRGVDPELFFPTGRDTSELVSTHLRAVRPICAACPVAPECLRWAIDTDQQHGLWAATTPSQRRRARRREKPGREKPGQEPTREPEPPCASHPDLTAAAAVSAPALAAAGRP